MNCPACGTADAYVGLAEVSCPNRECQHHDPRMVPDHAAEVVAMEVTFIVEPDCLWWFA